MEKNNCVNHKSKKTVDTSHVISKANEKSYKRKKKFQESVTYSWLARCCVFTPAVGKKLKVWILPVRVV